MSGSPSAAFLSISLGAVIAVVLFIAGADLLASAAWGAGACIVGAIACRITEG